MIDYFNDGIGYGDSYICYGSSVFYSSYCNGDVYGDGDGSGYASGYSDIDGSWSESEYREDDYSFDDGCGMDMSLEALEIVND